MFRQGLATVYRSIPLCCIPGAEQFQLYLDSHQQQSRPPDDNFFPFRLRVMGSNSSVSPSRQITSLQALDTELIG